MSLTTSAAVVLTALAISLAAPPSSPRGTQPVALPSAHASVPRFHHVHLVQGDPVAFADYYGRLFVPGRIERGEYWGHAGVRDARSVLLFSASDRPRRAERAVVWQMGWGKVSLDQSYRQHYAREVDWAPPYRSLSDELHLHLRTRDAVAAAEWYRDVLGGAIELSRDAKSTDEGVTRAIVRFDGLSLVLHVTAEPFTSSRDAGTVDHIAFTVTSLADLSVAAVPQAPGAAYALRAKRSAFVTAPDGLSVEVVEEP